MLSGFLPVLLAGLLSVSLCTLGIFTIWKHRKWAEKSTNYFMYFASGILISVAFLIATPKAFEMNSNGPAYLLAGFLGIFLINKFVDVYICGENGVCQDFTEDFRIGVIAALGIAFHSLVDGVIYSTTYTASMFIGTTATLGMIFHEFPEGVVTFSLFKKSGLNSKKSFLYAFIAGGITTPIGAAISYPFISSLGEKTLGALLGLSAGVLVYVGGAHLLPEAEKESKKYGLLAFVLGLIVAIGLWLIKGFYP
ncbi:hypothetical protein AKJ53_01370 [candidate division MSBL1 archaeon SCGC-AAA382F02]|uniref:Zinc permease n=1 Tax=candidate division MSBL1 archaeon SCGC-AAA382F02 TaxID=1698282 RepID=A0A133VI11_9EURY|nr:hypothetical protein AKJ53_01370 [candidate division MSBL1 archaeon SCGC-AAA382F02]